MEPSLTPAQDRAVTISMRVAAVFSLIGCLLIILTFSLSRRFRRPVNRLIFYASWGNLALAVMSVFSVDPIFAPYGPGSGLCTTQGFIIQMFLPSDALWNLAMAINVYLTIFKRWEVDRMKRLELVYLIVNFGAPFAIAFSYLFINETGPSGRGKIYGPASIWCWVSSEWAWLRIAFLYVPAWICIGIIFPIYVSAFIFIVRKRRGLNSARLSPPSFKRNTFVPLRSRSPQNKDPFYATKTTDVTVVVEEQPAMELFMSPHFRTAHDTTSTGVVPVDGTLSDTPQSGPPTTPGVDRAYQAYEVTINAGASRTSHQKMPTSTTISYDNDKDPEVASEDLDYHTFGPTTTTAAAFADRSRYTGVGPRAPGTGPPGTSCGLTRVMSSNPNSRAAMRDQTNVAWAYTKIALLYFVSLLSTWVPSSVNRVFSLVHANEVSFGMSLAAALVLPLVGFWNGLIYGVTSWDAVRELFKEGMEKMGRRPRGRR